VWLAWCSNGLKGHGASSCLSGILTNIRHTSDIYCYYFFFFQRLVVGIFVSGFAFSEDDYSKPWEGWKTNLERYLFL
jgi:hypothetical protein